MNYDEYLIESRKIILNTCSSLIKDEDVIHDVAQNLMMIDEGFRFDSYSNKYMKEINDSKPGYRYQMCKYLILNNLRKKISESKIGDMEAIDEPEIKSTRNIFAGAKDILSEKLYNIIEKYYLYGYTLSEVAEEVDKSPEWVRLNLKIAIEKLRKEYV